MASRKAKEEWGTRIGVIFAVMGSAIGLGNFLRFPGLAAKYDGGTFMIPYFAAVLLLGLPIAWMEWSAGRYAGLKGFNATPGIFKAVWNNPASPYLGVFGIIVPVGIYMYYVIIESWTLFYAVQYLTGSIESGQPPEYYASLFTFYTGTDGDGNLFFGNSPALWYLAAAFILNFIIIYRGISKGIEAISKIAIPVLFISAFIVLIRVLTLGTPDPAYPERNIWNALGFMWNPAPDFPSILSALSDSQMWLEAAGQVFFSLSVGFGIIITYSSYLKKKDDVVLSGTSSAAGNIFAEVALGGMITIPAAFLFLGAAGASEASAGTFQLGFISLPMVFSGMPLGNFIGFLWFFLLFLAALTSSISMLQPAIAFFEESLGVSRRVSVTMLGIITISGTLFIAYFTKEQKALDTMDFWIGTFFIFTLALIEVVLFAWVMGADRVIREAQHGALMKLPPGLSFVLKYITPLYLILVFGFWTYQNVPVYAARLAEDPVTRLTAGWIIILFVFFLIMIRNGVLRWKKESEAKR